jgi:hypothetical protein
MFGFGSDWMRAFWPAVQAFMTAGNPYGPLDPGGGFHNPPWLLPLLVPFVLLPPLWGAIARTASDGTGTGAVIPERANSDAVGRRLAGG